MNSAPPPSIPSFNGNQPGAAPVSLPLRHNKVVLVVDLVESVRLMTANEAQVVQAWRELTAHAENDVLTRYPGRVVEVELNNFRGRRVYEIKVVDNKGRLFEVYCDVRTGNIIKVERD